MMFRRLISTSLILSALVSAAGFFPVAAQSDSLSQAHTARIRGNCVSAQHTLTQLHANDALMRVNRGQIYEAVSVKLMAAMNSRVALNRLDGGMMVDITAAYNQELVDFRASYRTYERQLSAAMRVDCDKSPELFYDAVQVASDSRRAVHDSILQLHEYIRDYERAFDDFREGFSKNSQQGGS